jgi:glycine/D-amino acid oxidase-like deaminating enzyme
VLREVYDGAALIEGNRRLYEVMPGGVIPGVGRVEAIERRGRSWVVLTDKGTISATR